MKWPVALTRSIASRCEGKSMGITTEESTGTALVLSPPRDEPEIDVLVVLEEIHTKLALKVV
jgi:hypothetical protein